MDPTNSGDVLNTIVPTFGSPSWVTQLGLAYVIFACQMLLLSLCYAWRISLGVTWHQASRHSAQ